MLDTVSIMLLFGISGNWFSSNNADDCAATLSRDMNKNRNSCLVSETKPSDDLVQKARDLGLPDTFYNYLLLSDNSEDSETFPWERKEVHEAAAEVVRCSFREARKLSKEWKYHICSRDYTYILLFLVSLC